jgi:hypothetical protein
MFSELFNFRGINWWTLLGGLGLNFVFTLFTAGGGAYLASQESTAGFYQELGAPIMVLVIFLGCGLAGYIVGKIADDVPLKHAVWSSMGAVLPFVATAVLTFNPMQLMLGAVAAAGAFNGGMLASPRRRAGAPPAKGQPPKRGS